MVDRHGVTGVTVDSAEPAEQAADDPQPVDLVSTRNKLLRVKRRLAELKTQLRASRVPDPEAEVAAVPEKPASFFVGVEVEVDLARIAEEIAINVEELARLI